jgi:GT2 family glycosyltransferase
MTDWDHKTSRPVDQLIGAFFLTRRALFEHLGGFDERFFVYFEEVDFSYRAWKQGWQSYYLSEATAYHRGQGTTDRIKGLRLFYSLRSRIQYAHKHFGRPRAVALAFGSLCIEPWSRLALGLRDSSARATIEGYLKLWRIAPRLVSGIGVDRT